jgi:hypothetical protein
LWSVPQDEARVKAREKRSGRTGVPGPLARVPVIPSGILQGRCHRFPRRVSLLFAQAIAGARRPAATVRNATTKVVRTGKPAASLVTPALSGFRAARGNTVGSEPEVATVSQCGGSNPGGFGRETCRRKVPGSHPGTRKRMSPSRIERRAAVSHTGRRGRDRDKIRAREGLKTRSPA